MTQSTQGIIIGALISLLIGVIIGFYLRQSRINELSEAVQQNQKRSEELEQEHEQRLQVATQQLQHDYEAQLAEKIERYQDQYDSQISQIEAEYQARQSLMAQGGSSPGFDSPGSGFNPSYPAVGAISPNLESASDAEQRIRKQYETRLKEAAAKIQQAYEQHLKERLSEAREASQQDYDRRLAETVERYQDQAEERIGQALSNQSLQLSALNPVDGLPRAGMLPMPSPSGSNDVVLQERLAGLEAQLQADYEQRLASSLEHYQDEMAQRLEQMEQDYAARLHMMQTAQPEVDSARPTPAPHADTAAALEQRLKLEYEQRLAEAIANHQDELMQRTQALEAEFSTRLAMHQAAQPMVTDSAVQVSDPDLENRLRHQIETSLQAEYEQKLAERIEHYQNELAQRTEELEAGLEARLQRLQVPPLESVPPARAEVESVSPPIGAATVADFDLDELLVGTTEEMDLGSAPPPPAAATPPQAISPSVMANSEIEDFLTLDATEDLPDWPAESDEAFDLDNLDDLLKASDQDDQPGDDLFGSLDDLSNLS